MNTTTDYSSSTRHRHHHHDHHHHHDPLLNDEVEPLVVADEEDDGDHDYFKPTTTRTSITPTRKMKNYYVIVLTGIIIIVVFLAVWFGSTCSRTSKTKTSTSAASNSHKIKYYKHHLDITLNTGIPAYDDAFELALKEVALNIHDGSSDGDDVQISVSGRKSSTSSSSSSSSAQRQSSSSTLKFIAGAGWAQLWTRDTSYALELSLSILYPDIAYNTLKVLTETKLGNTQVWYQDVCGHFGGWPILTDAIVGAQGSWSLYLATGDIEVLEWAHKVTSNTLKLAEIQILDNKQGQGSGLFKGCSSFMESNSGYPKEYHKNANNLVGKSKALSTNVLYYNGYKIAAEMEKELQYHHHHHHHAALFDDVTSSPSTSITNNKWTDKATKLKNSIRSRLWMEDKGYYSYFEDENSILVPQMEGLGESLLLLADGLEHNSTRILQIFHNTPTTSKGLPCLWPRFEHNDDRQKLFNPKVFASYYHNGRIWPFVQGYWAIAAARHGQVQTFAEELDHLVELALGQSPYKYKKKNEQDDDDDLQQQERLQTFAEFYEINTTYVYERRRQLWSSAGYLGMILQGLFGIQLQPRGIRFKPVKPKHIFRSIVGDDQKTIVLSGLKYRQVIITIKISGYGSKVDRYVINGKLQKKGDDPYPFLSAEAKGKQTIEITLKE